MAVAVLTAALLLSSGACSSGGSRPTTPDQTSERGSRLVVEETDRQFLVDPLWGYPLVVAPEEADALRRAHRELVRGFPKPAEDVAREQLARNPGFHPAEILRGQVRFLEQDFEAAVEVTEPVLAELPEYSAALLLKARASERLDDVVEAFRAYRQVAVADATSDRSLVAIERSDLLLDRVLEVLYRRTMDALDRGRLDVAEELVSDLRIWAPEHPMPLAAEAELAKALDDPQAELAAVRRLIQFYPEDRPWLERQADLEVRVGKPRVGIQILRTLSEHFPGDQQLQERLETAKFRWRFSLQPEEVQQRALSPELTRADFATMLYWLVPGVRYGRADSGRIAADILDHPDREAIARVVNLGLMSIDESLHRFDPDRQVMRVEVMSGLLWAMERQQDLPACLGTGLSSRPAWKTVCTLAARCQIIDSEADCLPQAPAEGRESLEMIRRAQRLMVGGR
ncbi:MAG: hypothetical protein SX243_19960 [Acidobacteriota bacterium]|nr:hypothetical protein [Acidobacteriota bacterium]